MKRERERTFGCTLVGHSFNQMKGKRIKNINKPTLQYTPFTSGKPCYTCSDKEGNIGMGDTRENSYKAYVADKERKKIEREYVEKLMYYAYLNNITSNNEYSFHEWLDIVVKNLVIQEESGTAAIVWERIKQTLK